MYCPKCGIADQTAESYCRQCGTFLPGLAKPKKSREWPAQENLKVNTVLNLMTVIVSLSLAISLYVVLGFRPGTHPLIYVTAGLLLAMGGWHIQTFIRTRQLRKQFSRRRRGVGDVNEIEANDAPARGLKAGDFDSIVPASVTERTTRTLVEPVPNSPQSEQ